MPVLFAHMFFVARVVAIALYSRLPDRDAAVEGRECRLPPVLYRHVSTERETGLCLFSAPDSPKRTYVCKGLQNPIGQAPDRLLFIAQIQV